MCNKCQRITMKYDKKRGGEKGGGRTPLLLALSHLTIDHAFLSGWRKRGGGDKPASMAWRWSLDAAVRVEGRRACIGRKGGARASGGLGHY